MGWDEIRHLVFENHVLLLPGRGLYISIPCALFLNILVFLILGIERRHKRTYLPYQFINKYPLI